MDYVKELREGREILLKIVTNILEEALNEFDNITDENREEKKLAIFMSGEYAAQVLESVHCLEILDSLDEETHSELTELTNKYTNKLIEEVFC